MPLLGMQAKAVAAPDFPSRPVTFVVPYAAGSAGDLWARMISPSLSKLWGQPVLVENKPGAGALIGMGHVRHAKPDGHTLLLGSLSTSMAGLTKANLDFDPQVELVPVYKYLTFKIIFATNPRTYAQAKTLRDLAAYSQTLSNGIFAGDTGPGTAFNMSMGFVLNALNVKYQSVSYNGISAISLALVRDDVQVIINAPTSLNSFLHEKTMYPIAVLSEKRYADMPDVQTVREAGYEGFLPEIWNGGHRQDRRRHPEGVGGAGHEGTDRIDFHRRHSARRPRRVRAIPAPRHRTVAGLSQEDRLQAFVDRWTAGPRPGSRNNCTRKSTNARTFRDIPWLLGNTTFTGASTVVGRTT
jgi:tripartite-type tricarboxylate transporter receptor subunit TctC